MKCKTRTHSENIFSKISIYLDLWNYIYIVEFQTISEILKQATTHTFKCKPKKTSESIFFYQRSLKEWKQRYYRDTPKFSPSASLEPIIKRCRETRKEILSINCFIISNIYPKKCLSTPRTNNKTEKQDKSLKKYQIHQNQLKIRQNCYRPSFCFNTSIDLILVSGSTGNKVSKLSFKALDKQKQIWQKTNWERQTNCFLLISSGEIVW